MNKTVLYKRPASGMSYDDVSTAPKWLLSAIEIMEREGKS
jgi:hypothetical protein